MLLLPDSNSSSERGSLSKSSEAPKFTKTEPRIPFHSQRKSKLQSLISCPNTAVSSLNQGTVLSGSPRQLRLFYQPPAGSPSELLLHLGEEAPIAELVQLAKTALQAKGLELKEHWTFTIRLAKKNGKPKTDYPALEQAQILRECGDSGLFHLQAEELESEAKEACKGHKATRCSSSFGKEVYRTNSLLLRKGNREERDLRIKEQGLLERIFCFCSK